MKLSIEVAYTNESGQELVKMEVDQGSTVEEVVQASGLPEKYPEIISGQYRFGIYGKKVNANTKLEEYDRVEIYRPLKISPKEARRLRAKLADEKK